MEIRLILENLCVLFFRPWKVHAGFWRNFPPKHPNWECWNSNLHCHIDVQPGAAPLTMITGRNKLFSLVSVYGRQHSLLTNTGWTLLGQWDDTFQTSVRRLSSLYFHHLQGFNTFTMEFCYFKHKTEISRAKKKKRSELMLEFFERDFLMSMIQSKLSYPESLAGSIPSKILHLIFVEILCTSGSMERVTQQCNLFLNSFLIYFVYCHSLGTRRLSTLFINFLFWF